MSGLEIVQVNADRGIAPGTTKGAALHLRGVAFGLVACGHSVRTYSNRPAEGPFPGPVLALDELADVTEASLVYERYSLGHRGGLELARSLGVPFVLEINAPLVDEAATHRPGTLPLSAAEIEAELIAEADLVVTVSSALTRWAEAKRSGPVETILNGFEPSWFPPFDRRAITGAPGRASDGRFDAGFDRESGGRGMVDRIAFLGHPKPWHGANLLADLLVDLTTRGHRPELVVIGGGSGADALMARASDLGVGQQVVVTGNTDPDRVAVHLATASVGLAPYPRQDPFYFCPLKIVDYLAAGLPIVASDQGDIAELVHDAGILVEPDDPSALADAVADLLTDPIRSTAMGLAGRRRAFATMTWRQVGERTERAILRLPHDSIREAVSA